MKTCTIEFREADKRTFDAIRRGDKRFETRSPDARYRDIEAGDTIHFTCAGESCEKHVIPATDVESVPALIGRFGFDVVYPPVTSVEEAETLFFTFPGYGERIERDGLKVMELA